MEYDSCFNKDAVVDSLLSEGVVVLPNLDMESHAVLQSNIAKIFKCEADLLSDVHQRIHSDDINELRLKAFKNINELPGWESLYYSMAKDYLDFLFGPDLLIQRKLNLSVQMPGDRSSILGLHMDTLSGQSPFEVVVWVPFSSFDPEAGMYYFDRQVSRQMCDHIVDMETKGLDQLREMYWASHKYKSIQLDQILIFSGTVFHGNRVNSTQSTRFSINCRFKNLYSPEGSLGSAERSLGVFYKLLNSSPITKIGIEYSKIGFEF